MAAVAYARQTYQEMQVSAAEPERLVVMLFDAAHRFMLQAREPLQNHEYERQTELIVQAQRIYTELSGALDSSVHEELVGRLGLLYAYVHERLRIACICDDVAALDEAIRITAKLAAAWKEAEAQCHQQ